MLALHDIFPPTVEGSVIRARHDAVFASRLCGVAFSLALAGGLAGRATIAAEVVVCYCHDVVDLALGTTPTLHDGCSIVAMEDKEELVELIEGAEYRGRRRPGPRDSLV